MSYSITPSRYAAESVIIRPVSDDGWMTRAHRLAATFGRWSGREKGYVVKSTRVIKFEAMYAAGYDGGRFESTAKSRHIPN